MIHIVTTSRHQHTVNGFRRIWGASLRHVLKATSYEQLFARRLLHGGVYLFTDIDRLSPTELKLAGLWYDILVNSGAKVLTNPARFVGRLKLLNTLYESGVNQFNAFPANNCNEARFPVFLRFNEGHDGPRSELIHDRETLNAKLKKYRSGHHARQLIVVEFLNYQEADGHYYKYSHFRVGEQLIFGGMATGNHWCVKSADVLNQAVLDREADAATNHDQDELLMRCFETAGIEFGRIDYCLINGKVQVFEINSNPDIGIPCAEGLPRWPVRSRCYQAVNEALWALYQSADHDIKIQTPGNFSLYLALKRTLGLTHRFNRLLKKRLKKLLKST